MSRIRALAGAAAVAVVAAACSRGAATAPPVSPTNSPPASYAASLTPAQIADPGLPSAAGQGPLTQAVVRQMMQYFEDKVAQAYASDDADALYRYLAGDMLKGNRATVNLLKSQGKRNVFTIAVDSVNIATNDTTRITFDLTAAETTDYFVDTTGSTLLGGSPGPSRLAFLIFLDFNPDNHTWYWTGASNESSQGGANP